jgi:hypothetical protein
MGGHENQHERQESDYERRMQLVKLGQLDVLLWGSQSWLQPAFSATTRPRRDVMNQQLLREVDLLKIKDLSEQLLESRLSSAEPALWPSVRGRGM